MGTAKIILAISSITLMTLLVIENSRGSSKRLTKKSVRVKKPEKVVKGDTLDTLINAMIQVESTGNDNAVNHRTNAVGCLQIRPIMVEDVNRILAKSDSEKSYSLKDRVSRVKSIEMFHIWRNHYHKGSSMQKMARCWNGGTRGHLRDVTIKYWRKIIGIWKMK